MSKAPVVTILFDEGATATTPIVCAAATVRPNADRREITRLKRRLEFSPGTRELPSAARFREIGFHYTEDSMDTRNAFLHLLSTRRPRWFASVCTHPKIPDFDLETQFVEVTTAALNSFRDYEIHLVYEQNDAISVDRIVQKSKMTSTQMYASLDFNASSKAGEPLLALADYTVAVVNSAFAMLGSQPRATATNSERMSSKFEFRQLLQLLPTNSLLTLHGFERQVTANSRRHPFADRLEIVHEVLTEHATP